jgi:hypothetical protein
MRNDRFGTRIGDARAEIEFAFVSSKRGSRVISDIPLARANSDSAPKMRKTGEIFNIPLAFPNRL